MTSVQYWQWSSECIQKVAPNYECHPSCGFYNHNCPENCNCFHNDKCHKKFDNNVLFLKREDMWTTLRRLSERDNPCKS
jgi:hypothetical protein